MIFAEVKFVRPGGSVATFVLHPGSARRYDYPVDEAAQSDAAERLLAWAAGGADELELRRALAGRLVFVEDSFLRVAAAVGAIPIADLADYTFGDLEEVGKSD